MKNKGNVVLGAYYPSPSQDVNSEEFFYRQLKGISKTVAPVLIADFNFSVTKWEDHTAVTKQTREYLKITEANFLSQVFSETTKDALRLAICEWRRNPQSPTASFSLNQRDMDLMGVLLDG